MTIASKRKRSLRPPPSKGGRIVYFLLVMLILVATSALYVAVRVYARIDDTFKTVIQTRPPVTGTPRPTPNIPTDPINILLLGVDQREGEDHALSDVNIVIHVNPQKRFASMLSIPRDTRVYIPEHGYAKINAAYSLGQQYHAEQGGGAVWAANTVENFLGIQIDYYAQVNFRGFIQIVDQLEGITIDVPAPLVDNEYPTDDYGYTRIYIPAGLQHMDGATALQYSRSRHADSDIYRNQRQQQVLMAIRDRFLGLNLLTDMDKINEMLEQFKSTFRTDMQRDTIWALAQLAPKIDRENITAYAIDWECLREIEGTSDLQPVQRCVDDRVSAMTMDPVARRLRQEGAQITVLNGTLSCDGCAASTSDYLRTRGFAVIGYGNAENPGTYTHTLILDSGSHPFTLDMLSSLLQVQPDAARQVPTGTLETDIVIILGNDFQRLRD